MTHDQIFSAIEIALGILSGAVGLLPGDAPDVLDDVLDAVDDALPDIEVLTRADGWDADDVVAVRGILLEALARVPRLPTAEALSYADAFARLISRAVSAGLKQEAPTVRGRGRRRGAKPRSRTDALAALANRLPDVGP